MIRFIGYVFILAVSVSAFAAGLLIASAIFHERRQYRQLKALWRQIFKGLPNDIVKPPDSGPMCRCTQDGSGDDVEIPSSLLDQYEIMVPDHPIPPLSCDKISLEEMATASRRAAEDKLHRGLPYWQSWVARELVRRARRRELRDPVFTGTIEEIIRSSQSDA